MRPVFSPLPFLSRSKSAAARRPWPWLRAAAVLLAGGTLSPSLQAATWHVAPQGSDTRGAGSAELPWRTVQKAVDECGPGDAVLLHAGLYAQRVEFSESGLPGRPITLVAEPGAVFSGRGMPAGEHVIALHRASHIRLIGLEIRDTVTAKGGCGIHVEGGASGIEIRNCHLHHLRGKEAVAIGCFGTDPKLPLSGLVIEGCRIANCEPARSEALVLNGNVDGFRVNHNIISDINNIGIDFIGGERDVMPDPDKVARNGECTGNRVTRARSSYGDGYAAGIYVDGGRNILISGNTVTECDLGIEVGAENPGITTSGITVEDNILYRNDKTGLVFGGYDRKRGRVTGCLFRRNILWENTSHREAQAELWIQEAADNRVERNIIVARPGGRMALVSPGGVRNTLTANQWWSADGDRTDWTWGAESGRGFTAWKAALGSGQDAGAIWKKPAFPSPDTGDFGR